MHIDKKEKHQKTAFRLTLFCMLSLIIGGPITFVIIKGGGPEALGAIIPMIVVGAIHLFGAPIAILNAYKTQNHKKNIHIYSYFLFFIILSFLFVGPEAIIYYLLYALFIIIPIIFFSIMSFIRKT